MDREHILSDAIKYFPGEMKPDLLDVLHCTLHNDGYGIQANTEPGDVEWFADILYSRFHDGRSLRNADTETQEHWQKIARTCIQEMPGLMSRMAGRYILWSKVARSLELAERAKERREQS